MAVFTLSLLVGGLLAAGLSYFFIGAVGTILHLVAVAGGVFVAAGLFYNLDKENYLGLGDVAAVLSYGSASSVAGFLSYRLFEAVFAAASTGIALVAVLAAVVFILNPSIIFDLIVFIGEVTDSK